MYVRLSSGIGGDYSNTQIDQDSGTVPATILHAFINLNSGVTWNHFCGPSNSSGCHGGPGGFTCDARLCVSHEMGHAEGLWHCGIDFGVMCHYSAIASGFQGTAYWTPQFSDVSALKVIYP